MDDPEAPAGSVNQTPELYTSVKALAAGLHVSRQTIYDWFARDGCPAKREDGKFDAAEWREFAQRNASKTEAGQTEKKADLEAEELRVIIDDRKFRLAVKRGEFQHNASVYADAFALAQEVQTVLRAKFERELPTLYSADPAVQAAARALNAAAVDEICARLSAALPPEPAEGAADEE